MTRGGAHALLQATVLLWGLTGILGRLISIAAVPLVFYRLVITVAAMLVIVPARGLSLRVPVRAALRYGACGAVIGLHWLCFYGAIKETGVATAVLTLSAIPFGTALLEPLILRRSVRGYELVIGTIVVAGVSLLIHSELHANPTGIALGLGSAAFAALFGVINGALVQEEPPERLLLYEMMAALVPVTACFAVWPHLWTAPTAADWGWLVALALACTVLPQLWALRVLRVLSPFTLAVAVTLEPVYSIALAVVLFPETEPLGWRFLTGAAVLLGLVALNAYLKRKT
ncbi:MAG TPA: EamA family transporter [Kofleriaceae bacterium]